MLSVSKGGINWHMRTRHLVDILIKGQSNPEWKIFFTVIDPLNPLMRKRIIIHLGWGWPLMPQITYVLPLSDSDSGLSWDTNTLKVAKQLWLFKGQALLYFWQLTLNFDGRFSFGMWLLCGLIKCMINHHLQCSM